MAASETSPISSTPASRAGTCILKFRLFEVSTLSSHYISYCTSFSFAIGITLRPYQLTGVNWLVERYHRNHGCILGDEMGLGKTCQVCKKRDVECEDLFINCFVTCMIDIP